MVSLSDPLSLYRPRPFFSVASIVFVERRILRTLGVPRGGHGRTHQLLLFFQALHPGFTSCPDGAKIWSTLASPRLKIIDCTLAATHGIATICNSSGSVTPAVWSHFKRRRQNSSGSRRYRTSYQGTRAEQNRGNLHVFINV